MTNSATNTLCFDMILITFYSSFSFFFFFWLTNKHPEFMLYVITFETAVYLSADSLKIDVDLSRFFYNILKYLCQLYPFYYSESSEIALVNLTWPFSGQREKVCMLWNTDGHFLAGTFTLIFPLFFHVYLS